MDTTVFRLALKRVMTEFLRSFAACCASFSERCRQGESELTVLYTHGQPANHSTTAHYLSALLLDLLEDGKGLLDALSDVDRSTLGACAITGTGFPIDRARVAELLGMDGFVLNSFRRFRRPTGLPDQPRRCESSCRTLEDSPPISRTRLPARSGCTIFRMISCRFLRSCPREKPGDHRTSAHPGRSGLGLCTTIEDCIAMCLTRMSTRPPMPCFPAHAGIFLCGSAMDLAGVTFAGMRARSERARALPLSSASLPPSLRIR